jgi:uncharacterized protein YndB with AHSA1/START domain
MLELETDREIVVRRTIAGPRRLVFAAWGEARHLARWFGPTGFSTTTSSFEFGPGGVWDFVMHGPDGTDYPNWIRWLEIEPPARLRFEQGTRAGDPDMFETTVSFEERDGATEITLHSLFATKAQRDHVVEHYGAIEGGHQTLARLEEYVRELAAAEGAA